MITSATSGTSSAASGADAMKKETGLNKDDFLKLFVAQMQNQDPLNPQDGAAYITQLAQITQVEQSYNTNTNLKSLLTAQSNAMDVSAVSFIGKTVLAQGKEFSIAPGEQQELIYKLGQAVDSVKITISDASGKTVRTLSGGASQSGQYSMTWDGKDSQGQAVAAGKYSFTAEGNANGSNVTASTLVRGTVSGVRIDGSTPVVTVDGADVPLDSVIEVKGG